MARCRVFKGHKWPENVDTAMPAPGFHDHEGWDYAAQVVRRSGEEGVRGDELPWWFVFRDEQRGLCVRAAPLRHPVPCIGYVVDEKDLVGRLDPEKTAALGLPPGPKYKVGPEVQARPRHE